MRRKEPIDYVVDDFTEALVDLPMHIEDYDRPEDEIRKIFEQVFSLEVLEALNTMEL